MIMKKSLLALTALMVALFSMTIVSCGVDEKSIPIITDSSNQSNQTDALCGTWTCVNSVDEKNGEQFVDEMKGETLTVNEDDTYTSSLSALGSGTWTKTSNILIIKRNDEVVINVAMTLNGDNLRIAGIVNDTDKFDYSFTRVKE